MTTIYLAYASEKHDVPTVISAHKTREGAQQSGMDAAKNMHERLVEIFKEDDYADNDEFLEAIYYTREIELQE